MSLPTGADATSATLVALLLLLLLLLLSATWQNTHDCPAMTRLPL